MQRNWELIRTILLRLEQQSEAAGEVYGDVFPHFDAETVAYHMQLMKDAGLIRAVCTTYLDGKMTCVAQTLTWGGHELLDKIRNEGVWNQIKTTIKSKGLDLSIDAMLQ